MCEWCSFMILATSAFLTSNQGLYTAKVMDLVFKNNNLIGQITLDTLKTYLDLNSR